MREPMTSTGTLETVIGGVRRWSIHDERIDFRSEAYVLDDAGGGIAIDPLPLTAEGLRRLGSLRAIVLTGACHQRSAWSLRESTGAPVWAPRGAGPLEEPADRRYGDGPFLDGALVATLLVGPSSPHAALSTELDGRRVLWCGDLVMRGADGPFGLVPPAHRADPAGLVASVERLAGSGWDVVCPAHGAPLIGDGAAALRDALR